VSREEASVAVQVEIPRDVLGDVEPSQLGVELRRLWAVEQVRKRRIGVGKGAEVAGMPRAAFMKTLGEHGVAVIDYPVEDLREELHSLGPR
jgi:predicted HTH domain antitoxin